MLRQRIPAFVRKPAGTLRRRAAAGVICLAMAGLAGWGISSTALAAETHPAVVTTAITHAAELLPANSFVFVQVADPGAFVTLGQDERLWQELRQLDDVREGLESPQFQQFQLVISLLETRMGAKWAEVVGNVTGGGISLAAEPLQQSVMVVVKAKQPDQLTKLHDEIVRLMDGGARNDGKPSQAKKMDFNGVAGWSFGPDEFHCISEGMLLISNKESALKGMVDRLQGKGLATTLADSAEFKAAQTANQSRSLWGFGRVGALRILPQFNQALSGQSSNPVAELLFGGVLDVLGQAEATTFSLNVADGNLQLRAALPFAKSALTARRNWYFAEGADSTRPLLAPHGTIVSLSTYRNFSGFWLSRDDLFEETTLANLSQADTQLGTYFTGMEFGRDVLGGFEPGLRLVVARQTYAEGQPVPLAKFPAAAIVLEMKQADSFYPQILAAFQKTIGVVNIVGGMNGQPTLLLGMEDHSGAQIWKGTYLADGNTDVNAAPVNYNLSPSCARIGNHFVISTTAELARDLVDELKAAPAAEQLTPDNMHLQANFDTLASVLEENKSAIVAQNMLQQAQTQAVAEDQFELLVRLLRMVDPSSIRLGVEDQQLVLELSTGLKD